MNIATLNGHNGNGHNGNGKLYFPQVEIINPVQVKPQQLDQFRPHSIEAESSLIGALLIDPDAIIKISTLIQAGHFYIKRYGLIYQAILDLYAQNQPADLVLVSELLASRGQLKEIGGEAGLAELISQTPSSLYADHYARIVYKKFLLRSLIEAGSQIVQLGYDEKINIREGMDKAESLIFQATSLMVREGFGLQHIKAGLDKHYERMEYLAENKDKIVGLPTGIMDLDKLLGGLQRSDMIVMAGRPGMGKSALALSIALYAARKHQKRVAIFSLEMSEEQLIQRLIANQTGIDSQRIRAGDIKKEEWPVYYKAIQDLSVTQLFIDDTPAISITELRSRARRLVAEHGLDLLIVDYLQLMTAAGRHENRQQEVSVISRGIKSLARELDIPILALSQLSRQVDSRQNKRPVLSDLRESGSIEQDSDVVLFIYRDEVYNPDTEFPNIAELIIGKHRNGPTGMLSVYFKKHLNQFVDLVVRSMNLSQMEEKRAPRTMAESIQEWMDKD